MLGAALGLWVADLKSRLTGRLWSYALLGAAGFLLLCSGGYLVDALHGWVALSYGRIGASLIIAAMLLGLAGTLALCASRLGKTRDRPAMTGAMLLGSLRPARSTRHAFVRFGTVCAGLAVIGLIGRHWRRQPPL